MTKLVPIMILALTVNVVSVDINKNINTTNKNDNDRISLKLDGDKAPDFSLKSVDGKTIKLSDYKGKVVIIDFWATWCPPCRKGIPDLISIQKSHIKDVVIIGISLDAEKTIKDVPEFVKSYGINYPIVYGDEKVVAAYGGIQGIPTAFVIDRKGNIVDKHVGLVPKETYTNKIKELLKK
jgi:cytochrome c biogenesis protein CcmG/thiol:disulfide interchange protein DsbE